MVVSKHKPLNKIEIWKPRYHDNKVLIAAYKLRGENEIVFTRAKHLAGMSFYVDAATVQSCPTTSNGSISCYEVPFDKLTPLERSNDG